MKIPYRISLFACLLVVNLVRGPVDVGGGFAHAQTARTAVLKGRIEPHWFDNGNKFWYRNELADGAHETILVDAVAGKREMASDELLEKEVLVLAPASTERENGLRPEAELRGSSRTGPETQITFDNQLSEAVSIFWIDSDNRPKDYGQVAAKSQRAQHTFAGHRWLVENLQGDRLAVFEAADESKSAVIDGAKLDVRPTRGRRRGRNAVATGRTSERSPDGRWRALIQDQNVFVERVDIDGDAEEMVQLTTDGGGDFEYSQPLWSPDSNSLVAFRIEKAAAEEVHLVQSSPPAGGRALLTSRPYALPGDGFSKHELNVFDLAARTQVRPKVDRFEHGWEQPQVRWNISNGNFTYKIVDRGHQRLRIVSVDPKTGAVENVVEERSASFVWTIHTEDLNLNLINWLEKSDELIYVSERSGWRHLYLASVDRPNELAPLTSGEWVVRGIQLIDEEQRQVWFSASGCFVGQDPYLLHFGRVNFDGSGLVWLTAGDGNHTLQFSPDRRFVVDRFSRIDMPPKHELRRAEDGQLLCELEAVDASGLTATGWRAPEVFTAKGRDGQTDIWGIICRPRNYDPQKKYPVIEDIYAGPQGSFVPKSFSPAARYSALNELGFIVVKIDGMGTANRSKAFHDTCWQNLKDGGFEDRIAWIKSAAANYSELDVERVGIYGVSAGGQNAAAAVLFHPEFYKVAVAACGCHDNRMDKASWNEQWMGYPVGPHYSACSNIDNAHRLKGRLMLIVGELDDNVPPESTMRFADALIRADKDFELLVIPNAGHGLGGAYGERRMQDFFVRHLLSQMPPNRNSQ